MMRRYLSRRACATSTEIILEVISISLIRSKIGIAETLPAGFLDPDQASLKDPVMHLMARIRRHR